MMRRHLIILLLLLTGVGGCNILAWPVYVLFGREDEKVKAEYRGLEGRRSAILVVGLPAVEFEFPMADMDLALVSAYEIGRHVENADFVDPEAVDVFQRENLSWHTLGMREIGRHFEAERIIYLDLLQFTLQEENSVNLLRGQIIADVRVYEVELANPDQPAYQTEVTAVFPPMAPVPTTSAAQQNIYVQTMHSFADTLAQKFYDHKQSTRK